MRGMNEPVTGNQAVPGACASQREQAFAPRRWRSGILVLCGLAFPLLFAGFGAAQTSDSAADRVIQPLRPPVRLLNAQRLAARREGQPGTRIARPATSSQKPFPMATAQGASTSTWTPLGPNAVLTPHYGLVTGRVTAVAFDPADATGNHVYIGTTGGGVWVASNAAGNSSQVSFVPLTDNVSMTGSASHGNLSIGALTVQPGGGTGVVLAGTGDPNNVLDSYYGGGILRSTDGGTTWSLISGSVDQQSGTGIQNYSFLGEAFAGFAWSTANPQLVVAAAAQAYEGALVDAVALGASYQGLYYSNNAIDGSGVGAAWHLATIRDGATDVQGPMDRFARPDGNAATAVVWNPVRKLFLAAVRFHGYYESVDGVIWTRLANQPGAGLTAAKCPADAGSTGSTGCPIFRGALAVDPQSGDTYAWTVDANEQDQGLWEDRCQLSGGACTNSDFTFDTQWNTAALEENTLEGPATIVNGVYTLALSAVPRQQTTMVLAGANDLWQAACPVSQGCSWRNTTNAATCMSAQVGLFQHVAAWPDRAWAQTGATQKTALEQEILVGNDSGLWRSLDGIAESGAACDSTDASHFQNLNGTLGSLAEVESLSPVFTTPYTLMAGLGVNGTAGVKSGAATTNWPQILGGYGGPVAVDPIDENNWYVNAQAGVDIHRCSTSSPCTPADFGSSPVVTNADVGGDGATMPVPAPFMVDPLDPTQLLVATCRLWRGPATGGWSAAGNAISPILDSAASPGPCQGNALVRTLAAMPLSATREVIYAGMYGVLSGGGRLAGHVLKATLDTTASGTPSWTDLTANPVSNDVYGFNAYGMDISSTTIDSHDATGNTVYVTVKGMAEPTEPVQTVYRSTDGGATWSAITGNLPKAPANALVVDPQNSGVVYVATDQGVSFTTQVDTCAQAGINCWSQLGSDLPLSSVVALSASPSGAATPVLVAGTYGRGIWQTPLWTAESNLTAASMSPGSLSFPAQVYGTPSDAQTITLLNTGSADLAVTKIAMNGDSGDFTASGCQGQSVPAGGSCTVSVTFNPQASGARSAQMILFANVYGGQLEADLSGTGLPGGNVTVTPSSLDFGTVEAGTASTGQSLSVTNAGTTPVPISSITVTAPFVITSNACGGTSIAGGCQIQIEFAPTQAGPVTGLFTMIDAAGTQTVQLTGTGAAAPTDTLSPTSISFPATASGQISAVVPVAITNDGDLKLVVNSITVSAGFQQKSDCPSVAAHTNCVVSVQFAPAQTGTVTGTLTITDDLRTQTVALSGTGLQPASFTASPASLDFPQQQPGVASAPQTITITNSGGVAMADVGLRLTGPGMTDYTIVAKTCGPPLNSGASCTVQISFTPPDTGSVAAALAISSSTPGVTAAQVQLNGSGELAGGIATNLSQLPFPSAVGVGQASAAQSITIGNSTKYAISTMTLTATGPFSLTQNTCTAVLAAGATCTAAVVFQPSSSGAASGTLTVSSAVVSTPATVALSGTGFDFAVAASGPSSVTVASGQSANYKLSITPSGTSGTFSFQCGSLPSNAFCLFNPTTEQVAAGVEGYEGIQIYTGSSATARVEAPAGGREWPVYCVLVFAPVLLWRRRRLLLIVLAAVVLAGGVSSCTGSGGGAPSGSSGQSSGVKTPAGTYSIPVTVTSTGISHSLTLTLTVD